MKRFTVAVFFLLFSGFLFAQQSAEVGAANPELIGIDTAQQHLKEVSVDKFEKDGYWRSTISADDGYVISRLFEGGPTDKEPLPDEEGLDIPDRYVLGTRVDFIHRAHTSIFVYPQRPIPVEGVTKTVSVSVVGRNYNHELYLQVEDFFGRHFELWMGKLNFQGWKKMTATIPPQSDDGRSGIVQRNYHYNNQSGLKITGFRIKVDPSEAFGSYYVYFDDLRAVTDLFAEDNQDANDMSDAW